jgi:sugar-specific transcriptional regulator TrmB
MGMETANNEAIKILQCLGLTFTQARIYLALVILGESPVRSISQTSGVAKAEVYRRIPTLLRLGLVEKKLDLPIRFKAVPLQNGLNILLKQKTIEHNELLKKTEKLVNNFKEKNEKKPQEIESQFSVIPGQDAHIEWLRKRFKTIQISVDSIVTRSDENFVHFFLEKENREAAKRGIKRRKIIYIPKNQKNRIDTNIETLTNSVLNSQKRIVFDPPLVLGGSFDKKNVVIATTLNDPLQNGETVFWSSNISIVALFQSYFEELWKKSLDYHNTLK